MFRNPPATEPARDVATPPEPLVPLSVLSLDLPEPSVGGWPLELARRGIEIAQDDIGRPAVARSDARMLLGEQREAEARKLAMLARHERQAVEADQLRRSQIWKGLPADYLPVGVRAGDAMLQAARDSTPRRESLLEHALSNSDELTFHPISHDEE